MLTATIHRVEDTNIKELEVPETFDEVKRKRFFKAAPFLFEKGLMEYETKTWFFCAVTGYSKKAFIKLFREVNSNEDTFWGEGVELINLLESVDPLLEEISLSTSKAKWYLFFKGPTARFTNIKLKQYRFTDPYFTACIANKVDEELLNDFLSHLYRPFGLPYLSFLIAPTKWFVKRWPRKKKLALLLNYIGIRNALAHEFEELFGGPPSDSADPLWVQKMIYDMPSEKFGKLNDIENMSVPEAFEFLNYVQQKEKEKK